ncbi:glucose/arabinose dehydrogenase [Nitrosomonas sp. Nm84]|uniref:PQQ-dependent sugar dehydrogenase n=1 Tax=Nitrosomonas sp. Nm84 TaxID=200124 RepID=UPI000D76D9B6|nr:PQQ-dependent sugar dehydrogenase [Nitrosomonas sp. Nm84]PXW88396.1 glucose/arabinose dehydrogenase [Nitrosomonas sp. Nm84]
MFTTNRNLENFLNPRVNPFKQCPVIIALVLIVSGHSSFAASWPELSFVPVVNGLERPIHITHAGDGKGRLFIVEQSGRIRIVSNSSLQPTPFLDISDRVGCCGERGLLSAAFPPDFAAKGYFYVNYTNTAGNTVVSRFSATGTGDVADATSESIILTVDQPFSNHNGGQIAFGPDGMLYIGMGDGGGGGDPLESGQNPSSLLGKLLKIDVESGAQPYAIPANNPFAGASNTRPEIWASGLRNPWRFSFDRESGDLYIADVGQGQYEEINVQAANSLGGENYGWNILEGAHCFQQPSCDTSGLINPVLEYDHVTGGQSVTGGHVYRGGIFPRMRGVYLFGDFVSGRLAGMRRSGSGFESTLLADTDFGISSLGEDESGEVYVADINGTVYRIEDNVRYSELTFTGLLASYQPDDPIHVTVTEISPQRSVAQDLWVAISTPDGQFLYLSGQPGVQFSTEPQPFKHKIDPNVKLLEVLNLTLPSTILPGTYRLYAIYNDPNPGTLDLSSTLRSNIAEAVIVVGN